jgi:SlyX protein
MKHQNQSTDTDMRLTNLEIKTSYNEDLLDKLDQIIIRQQDQIDRLTRELAYLHQRAPEDTPSIPRDLRDDFPPHY